MEKVILKIINLILTLLLRNTDEITLNMKLFWKIFQNQKQNIQNVI